MKSICETCGYNLSCMSDDNTKVISFCEKNYKDVTDSNIQECEYYRERPFKNGMPEFIIPNTQ